MLPARLLASLGVVCVAAPGLAAPILVDFNDVGTTPTLGGTWNVIAAPNAGPQALLDSSGGATGATLASSNWGGDSGVTETPWSADQDWLDADATRDYIFYGTVGGAAQSATVTLAGLTPNGEYTVAVVSSKATSSTSVPRTGNYQVNGSYASSTPNGLNFDSYNTGFLTEAILTWESVFATAGGTITLTATTTQTSRSVWLNAMMVEAVPEPVSLSLLGFGTLLLLPRRRRA